MILRLVCLAVIASAIAGPLVYPLIVAITSANAWSVWREADRIMALAGQTCSLVCLTVVLVVPQALLLAVYLSTANLPFRKWAVVALLTAIGLPLAVFAVAWQSRAVSFWSPFSQGVLAAACVHALAGLPWVTFIIAIGFRQNDPAAMDDAKTHAGWLTRFLQVQLPGCWPYFFAAAVWIAIQCSTEIVVTDVMQVRTFGEEVYTQFVSPSVIPGRSAELALARAVMVSLPATLLLAVAAGGLCIRSYWALAIELKGKLPDDQPSRGRLVIGLAGLLLALVPIALPAIALVVRSGIRVGQSWSITQSAARLWLAVKVHGESLLVSLLASFLTAGVLLALACPACWFARGSRTFRLIVILFGIVAVATPAPIIGIGIKVCIDAILDLEQRFLGIDLARRWLYHGPSYLPVMWAWFVRGFPLAVLILWPTIRRLPSDFGETTRLYNQSWRRFVTWDLFPTIRIEVLATFGLVGLFAFGEVSASRIVATPGGATVIHDVFTQMHFGVTPELAAICLTVLAAIVAVSAITLQLAALGQRRHPGRSAPPPR